jgi:DASH complex subunit DAM1
VEPLHINKPQSTAAKGKGKGAILQLPSKMSSSITPQAGSSTKRSTSGSRRPLSRPTTPLRPSSRSSLRESGKASISGASDVPLEAFEPSFAELSDSMADLEANFMHLQLMHESLARFSENFASFLYGLNMNAFCVDFPEVESAVTTMRLGLMGF